MAVLRLFASARDAAGTGRDTLPGATVGEVLAAARRRYGPDFAAVLERCQIWCNGEATDLDQGVSDDDEVAVLPPVSGGAGAGAGGARGARAPRRAPLPPSAAGPPTAAVDRVRPRRASTTTTVEPVTARRRTRRSSDRPTPATVLRRRYAVVYDIDGPRVRLGLAWFIAVVVAVAVGPLLLVPIYAVAAAWAGLQTATAWRLRGSGAHPRLAAAGGAVLPVAAAFGPGLLGLGLVTFAAVAAVAHAVVLPRGASLVEAAGTTVQSGAFAGMAGAGVVLTLRLDVGATVALLLLVASYEVGDYLVGSGAASSLEGPAAGVAAVAVTTFVIAALQLSPFGGTDALVFGALAALACPVGQLLGSAVLPSADAPAPALRRLDSLLLLAPLWAFLIGLYLQHLAR